MLESLNCDYHYVEFVKVVKTHDSLLVIILSFCSINDSRKLNVVRTDKTKENGFRL